MSALSLMAAHDHKHVKISPDDVVVISAHAIPGNESNVARVIDSMYRAGAEVVHDRTSPVHVSGHASQEELKFMLSLLQPEWFVPVHGEYRHLVNHARLAHEVGVADDNVIICEDGDAVVISASGAEVERRAVPAGYMYVDGIVGDVEPWCVARPAHALGGGCRRGHRHRRVRDGRNRHRTRDRHPGLGVRAGGRRSARRRQGRRRAPRSRRRPTRAPPTSTRCGATAASRSPVSSMNGPVGGRR